MAPSSNTKSNSSHGASAPAIIIAPKIGRFCASAAIVDQAGWVHARGRARRPQAGSLPDLLGPVRALSWSPAQPVRIEWRPGS